jgi:hypothetical protein
MDVIRKLQDASGADIVDMNSSWTTKTYALGDNLHLCVHLFWDNISPTGTMTLEYSGDPEAAFPGDTENEATSWIAKNVTNVDGTYSELMYLDANLPVAAFRVKFQYLSGAADLEAFIVKKRG